MLSIEAVSTSKMGISSGALCELWGGKTHLATSGSGGVA